MATIQEMKELASYCVKGTAPANYSNESVESALRDAFQELAGSVNQFMKNMFLIRLSTLWESSLRLRL